MCRHHALEGVTSDVSPIHWQYGAIARLGKGEKIDKLLHQTVSYQSRQTDSRATLPASHITRTRVRFPLSTYRSHDAGGSSISYVEIPNLQHNLPALEELVKFIYDNIQYAEFKPGPFATSYCLICA